MAVEAPPSPTCSGFVLVPSASVFHAAMSGGDFSERGPTRLSSWRTLALSDATLTLSDSRTPRTLTSYCILTLSHSQPGGLSRSQSRSRTLTRSQTLVLRTPTSYCILKLSTNSRTRTHTLSHCQSDSRTVSFCHSRQEDSHTLGLTLAFSDSRAPVLSCHLACILTLFTISNSRRTLERTLELTHTLSP